MAEIIIADTTRQYDGTHLETQPLGGTESSVIRLARELARRRHAVTVYTNCTTPVEDHGVMWRPIAGARPETCDLYVACQHPRLLRFVKRPKRRAIWVLWQPNHLKHYKQIGRVWWYRPVPVLQSLHQVTIYSPFLPRRDPQILIPLGLPEDVRGHAPLKAPPPRRAIFASNPQRNLGRLVEIWADKVLPRVPDAVLDVYGVHDIPPGTNAWDVWSGTLLPANQPAHVRASVVVHPSATREGLIEAMRGSRVLVYLSHKVEAFCLAVAEAQALGVPAVVAPVAAVPERVLDGITGFHEADPDRFAERTVALLTDDALWRRQHEAAIRHQQGISWSEYAGRFEAALLADRFPITRSVLALPPDDSDRMPG
ncbi:glycosyl transferase family 1 [Rhodoplanes elegans]|uniref:Glycosyl transferase family 1 n=1 Tax=Rhodoplanes elegans TaxID=29408 RepID=A0A327KM44_9BRAD|nr:glycosyltransferase [Rhodoplanes elegans]MBK5959558.1 glycosyl transferase family 1 [Rhodoplanes elegans]RAI39116.1 glycosyl transferase family 1 [Rhodoplanes elegans]